MTDGPQRLDALLQVALRVAARARSGRVALAHLAASLDPAWIPLPAGAELAGLLERAAEETRQPLELRQVERILRAAWGGRPSNEIDELESEPIAVTPAAQVHRGRVEGTVVAIKVVRPGLASAVRQDVVLLEALAAPLAAAFPALDTGAILREVRDRALEELDLESEATIQRRLSRALRSHPQLTVPAPITRLCHEDVLVSEFVEGVPLAQAPDRDRHAAALLEFVLGAAREGIAYADPHEDNAIVTPDGRLAVVDFGACRIVASERVALGASLLAALVESDAGGVAGGLDALGWLAADWAEEVIGLAREIAGEHLTPGPTRLDTGAVIAARQRLIRRAREVTDLLAAGSLAPEDLWPARGVAVAMGTLARLEATGDWTAIALRALRQGFV